jgi:hypothetical protein
LTGSTTECIETTVTGTGSVANPYVITSEFTCLGPNAGGTLGYEEVTANQGGITTETDLTGLSVTVTVGASRRIKVTAAGNVFRSVADGTSVLRIKEGVTTLQRLQYQPNVINEGEFRQGSAILTPSAGSHTYKLSLERTTGTGTVTFDAMADRPGFILVEDIGAA